MNKLLLALSVIIGIPLNAQELKSKTDDIKKSALIFIETQNEWMHPDGLLYGKFKDRGVFQKSIRNLEATLAYARREGMPIIHCGLRFQKGYPELGNAKIGLNYTIKHAGTFPANTFNSEFYDTLKPIEGEFVVSGRTGSSGFAGSNLDIYLRQNRIETLYLAGYATNVCIESTFREASDKGYSPVIIEDACATFDKEQQEYVLKYVVHHYGESITSDYFMNIYNK